MKKWGRKWGSTRNTGVGPINRYRSESRNEVTYYETIFFLNGSLITKIFGIDRLPPQRQKIMFKLYERH